MIIGSPTTTSSGLPSLAGGGLNMSKQHTRIGSGYTSLSRDWNLEMVVCKESAATLQTDGSVPNTLVIANCEVVKPRVAAVEHISEFNEEACSPFVKKYKTIIHPAEVNRIRELPQNS
ncbi:WD-40 repeat-containing protein MSI4-like [Musa acuminata AAA Group]|uniref:WD-40 repeat-containing protein MSI4-like n=1 Tax=Musa acuminata AAA Group TaxID=214697 RepID=UPI0031D563D5